MAKKDYGVGTDHQSAEGPLWRPPARRSLLVQFKVSTQLNSKSLQEFIAAAEQLANWELVKLPETSSRRKQPMLSLMELRTGK
jgi:hypothetical protein